MKIQDAIALVWPHIPQCITAWDQCRHRAAIAQDAGCDLDLVDRVVAHVRDNCPDFPLVSHEWYGLGHTNDPALITEYSARRVANIITRVTRDEHNFDRHLARSGMTPREQAALRLAYTHLVQTAKTVVL